VRSSRVLRYVAPHQLQLDVAEMPDPEPGDLLVRVRCCGICGTDLHIYEDGFTVAPGQALGHEFSAEVVDPSGIAGLQAGDRVVVNPTLSCGICRACRDGQEHLCHDRQGVIGLTAGGAFADYVVVPKARLGAEVLPIPDSLSDAVAALTEPLAVGLHAVNVSDIAEADHAIVYGAGTIGLCVVRWLAVEGVRRIVVVDPLPLRRRAAMLQGAAAALDPFDPEHAAALEAELAGAQKPGKADVVIECAGAPGLVEAAIAVLRPGGRLTLAAVRHGVDGVPSMRVLFKELTVRGAMSYTWAEFAGALEHAVEWGADLETLISHRFALDDALAAFEAQLDRDASLKVMVVPGEAVSPLR
jgi:(R,R)-butanediol dehydrogenase/meso-butanediol dehydrogenase/diacetyl reductase